MLFNESPQIPLHESYKERNLYYKIFSGYIFNEYISGYKERKEHFLRLLIRDDDSYNQNIIMNVVSKMMAEDVHVDFDHHACQIDRLLTKSDRGEFADILISCTSGLIAIEAKLQSNWTIEKDIKANQKRIIKVVNTFGERKPSVVHALLVTKEKLTNGKNKNNSQYSSLMNGWHGVNSEIGFVIITWEDIAEKIITDLRVKEFLLARLKLKKVARKSREGGGV